MTKEKLGLKTYLSGSQKDFTKDNKKLNKKTPKNQFLGSGSKFPAAYAGVHESILNELLGGSVGAISDNVQAATAYYGGYVSPHKENKKSKWVEEEEDYEEDAEQSANKIDLARQLFQALINRPDATRKGIIQQFIDNVGVTHSTAVSYYERLAKEAGLTGKGDGKQDIGVGTGMETDTSGGESAPVDELPADTDLDLDDEVGEPDDSNRAGVIRTIDDAHLIFKQQDEEGKFEELWIYNTNEKLGDELNIRRAILAGTDIPPKKTRSPDGTQTYTLTTLGNAQFVHIKGLPN